MNTLHVDKRWVYLAHNDALNSSVVMVNDTIMFYGYYQQRTLKNWADEPMSKIWL